MNSLLARVSGCILLSAIIILGQTLRVKPTEQVLVGLLDDVREGGFRLETSPPRQRVIRPLFEKTSSGWRKMDVSSLPTRMTWTIAFDGRNLGQVESQTDTREGLTPLQTILNAPASVPSVGSPSESFGGLLGTPQDKFRRPLVAVSKPYFRDPDGWKRTKLTADVAALVGKAFRRDYPHVDRCKDEEISERNWKFPDSALTLPVAYISNKHTFLVEARLNAGDCGYVDDPDDPLSDPWFLVSSDGTVRKIGSFMTLLDAGDYDNDGHSEVIFFLSQGENMDGFVMFDANFNEPTRFIWSYH